MATVYHAGLNRRAAFFAERAEHEFLEVGDKEHVAVARALLSQLREEANWENKAG